MKALKWLIEKSENVGNFRVFSVERQESRSQITNKSSDFFVLDAPDWVNVIATTANKEVILIRQYRHGTDSITLEIPGGAVEKGEHSEALSAAKRELSEETGYESSDWISLGVTHPNPAILNNRCHFYLAQNARLTGEQQLDPNEEIEVEKRSLSDIPRLIQSGQITHSLVIAAFYYYQLRLNA